MTLTGKKKKLLAVLLFAVAVIGAATAILFWIVFRPNDPGPSFQDTSAYDAGAGTTLLLQNPQAQQASVPLSRYPITAPEGWEQLQDSARIANRYSREHSDLFYRDYRTMRFSQTYAADQTQVAFPAQTHDTVQFGGLEVICYTGEYQSGAVWVAGDHLLQLTCSGEMNREELLEWVAAVEEENPQLPQTCPLEFVPGYIIQVEGEEGLEWQTVSWRLGGNPEPSALTQQYVFNRPPEGFTLADPQSNGSTGVIYQNQTGDSLTLENLQLGPYGSALFTSMHYDADYPKDPVEPVIVHGQQGLLYLEEGDFAVLVWLEGDYYVRLTYEGSITSEQMLSLAESLVQKPVEEDALSQ